MIIEKNMNIKMEVTPEIVIEFFKEATYDEIMTTYNGMPREIRSEIASHFLSDLASTDMNEYRRFIGDSKPEYSNSVREPETKEIPETQKDSTDTKYDKDNDEEEFKVGDLYKWGDHGYIALEIIDVTDDYIKLRPNNISNPFISLLRGYYITEKDFNETDTIRKDVFRFMLKTKLIEKIK